MKETTFDKQTELPKLADRLGLANALIIDLLKEVSKLQLKSGKDSSYIDELEYESELPTHAIGDGIGRRQVD
jgi:hypothetical protein